jgi:hypothetical protein
LERVVSEGDYVKAKIERGCIVIEPGFLPGFLPAHMTQTRNNPFGGKESSILDDNKSDGSTASYYELPEGATELQHLISHRNMNAQDGEIFRAIYRKGRASHSDELRDAKKVLFYAQAEVERLETKS